MKKTSVSALLFCLAVAASCTSSSNGYGTDPGGGVVITTCPENTVCLRADNFLPTELTVVKGTIVTFSNSTAILHHVVFDTPRAIGVDDIGDIQSTTANRMFPSSGTFPFHCTIHGGVGTGMHGQIVVP